MIKEHKYLIDYDYQKKLKNFRCLLKNFDDVNESPLKSIKKNNR